MNVFKKIGLFIAGAAAGIIAFVFRDLFIRGRVPGNNDSTGELRSGITEAGRVNKEAGERIDRAQEAADDIRKDNQSARSGIARAREILEKAKERSTNDPG